MTGEDTDDVALRGYLDALLQEPATGTPAPAAAGTIWQACRLGRLHLLLPGDSTGRPMGIGEVETTPPCWHLARIRAGMVDWRVLDLARSIAPRLACASVDALLPVTGTRWLLAVPAQPVPMRLSDDAIEWREQRSSRPWLTGMSRDGQYMTLDILALIAQVADNTDTAPEECLP